MEGLDDIGLDTCDHADAIRSLRGQRTVSAAAVGVSGRFAMTHRVLVIPGDGIGAEIMPHAVRVLEALGLSFAFDTADLGRQRHRQAWHAAAAGYA